MFAGTGLALTDRAPATRCQPLSGLYLEHRGTVPPPVRVADIIVVTGDLFAVTVVSVPGAREADWSCRYAWHTGSMPGAFT